MENSDSTPVLDKTPKPRYSPERYPHPSASEKDLEFSRTIQESPCNIEFYINPQAIIQNIEMKSQKKKGHRNSVRNVVPKLDYKNLRRFKTGPSCNDSEVSYNRLESTDSNKVETFEELEAKISKTNPKYYESNHKKSQLKVTDENLPSARSIRFAKNVAKSPIRDMKRRHHLATKANRVLKTPKSGKNISLVFSGKGSGALLSNRRGRFWNNNTNLSKSGRKSVSPNKKRLGTGFSSSKKYDEDFVNKMENFKNEIEEFKVEVDEYLSSPRKRVLNTVNEFYYNNNH